VTHHKQASLEGPNPGPEPPVRPSTGTGGLGPPSYSAGGIWGDQPSIWAQVTQSLPCVPAPTQVGGGVLTVAHALQEVFEGLSQLSWLQEGGRGTGFD
jgi:hypothetical protein